MHPTPVTARSAPLDLMRQVSRSFKLIIAVGVAGAIAGAILSHFMHPKWVARMTIQVGQIAEPTVNGIVSHPIENQLTAADRYNLPAMRLHVLSALGLPDPESGSRPAKVVFDTLTATPARSPDLIMVQVSAYSRDEATAALLTSFKTFSAIHEKMFGPAVNDLKNRLATSSAKLTQAEQDYARAYQSLQSSSVQGSAGSSDPRTVLLTNMTSVINTQVLDLQQQTNSLQQALSPLLTYPTRIVEAPYTPLRSGTPSTPLLIAIGAVLGLLTGIAFAVRGSIARRR